MYKLLAKLGANLWENNGYWIDKERSVVQMDYTKLPLLGKIGYNLMMYGIKRGYCTNMHK